MAKIARPHWTDLHSDQNSPKNLKAEDVVFTAECGNTPVWNEVHP